MFTREQLPQFLVKYVPAGHRLWFAPRHDPDLGKPKEKRNPNAQGGMNRRDWIVCVCGNGLRLERSEQEVGTEPNESEWLEAVNGCRLSVHSQRKPCLPIDMDGKPLPLREAPPSTKTIEAPEDVEEEAPEAKRAPGRPKKQLVEA